MNTIKQRNLKFFKGKMRKYTVLAGDFKPNLPKLIDMGAGTKTSGRRQKLCPGWVVQLVKVSPDTPRSHLEWTRNNPPLSKREIAVSQEGLGEHPLRMYPHKVAFMRFAVHILTTWVAWKSSGQQFSLKWSGSGVVSGHLLYEMRTLGLLLE